MRCLPALPCELQNERKRIMNLEVQGNLLWLVLVIGGVLELLKLILAKAKIGDGYKEFIPYVAIGFGIAASWGANKGAAIGDIVMTGIGIGILASGGYDALKPLLDRIKGGAGLPVLLLLPLLLIGVGCYQQGVTLTPDAFASIETQAANLEAQADKCDTWLATLPVELQAQARPFCDTLRDGAGHYDAVLAESIGASVEEYRNGPVDPNSVR